MPYLDCTPLNTFSKYQSLATAVSSFGTRFAYHLHTMYLFTARDIITCIIPITVFACVAGPVRSWSSLIHAIIWVWVHLLQCNVSNQCTGAAEDALNKAWRPIPAGRLSIEQAWRLRYALPFLCIAISAPYGTQVIWASAEIAACEFWYDELGGALQWATKTLCGGIAYSMFAAGASLIASDEKSLNSIALKAVVFVFAIFTSTLHAADFPDVSGDRAQGRVTLPMLYPNGSRVGFALTLIAWSVYLAGFSGWALGPICRALLIAFGAWIGARIVHLRDQQADKASYNWYDVWVITAFLLPAHARWGIMSF